MHEQESFIIGDLIAETAQILTRAGVPEARLEAMSLIGYVIGRDRTYLITHPETLLAPTEVGDLREFVEQRAAGRPLQYITGRQAFYGLELEVTPDVLIPRPETELLVEAAIELLDASSSPGLICDIGTGSGCVAVAILRERPTLRALGIDLSLSALRVAARNAESYGTRERLALIASDCFAALDSHRARFAMIVSNPPYVAEAALPGLQREVRDHEPRVALTPGGDGLDIIRRLLTEAPLFLEAGGYLLMEIGFDQHEAVRQLTDSAIWRLLDIQNDLQGIPRVVALQKG